MNIKEAIKYTDSVRKRQYKTGKVSAFDFKFLPREKQLIAGAQARASDGRRIYKTTIIFEGINSSPLQDLIHKIPYSGKEGAGAELYLVQPTADTRIRMRCQCDDYYFMWQYWNKGKKALVGPHKTYVPVSPPSGRPPVNPDEAPGMCKHLLAMTKELMKNNLIVRDNTVWNYLNQPTRD